MSNKETTKEKKKRVMPRTERNTPSVQLVRPKEAYQMQRLENPKLWTEQQMREEYSRLRAVANKRLARLQKSDFAESEAVRQNVGKFSKLSEISDRHELATKLNEVQRFLTAKSSTVSGQKEIRAKVIKSLSDAGFDITEKDYAEFGKFMEWARRTLGPDFDSEQAADIYSAAKKRGVSINVVMSNYKTFQDNYDMFVDVPKKAPEKPGGETSADDVLKSMGIKPGARGEDLNEWYSKNAAAGNWAKKATKRR